MAAYAALEQLPGPLQLSVLDAADMLLRLRYGANILADARGTACAACRRAQDILDARMQLSDVAAPSPPAGPAPPHRGHQTTRMGLGFVFEGPMGWAEVSLRAALHDSLDPSIGFAPYGVLEVMKLRLRVSATDLAAARAPMQLSLDVLRLMALKPWTRWAKPVSWRGGLGLTPIGQDRRAPMLWAWALTPIGLRLDLGLGLSMAPLKRHAQALLYGFVDVVLDAQLRYVPYDRLQVQAALGVVWRNAPHWSAQAEIAMPFVLRGHNAFEHRLASRLHATTGLSFAPSARFALRFVARFEQVRTQAGLCALFYF
jgi:hypothetical protein